MAALKSPLLNPDDQVWLWSHPFAKITHSENNIRNVLLNLFSGTNQRWGEGPRCLSGKSKHLVNPQLFTCQYLDRWWTVQPNLWVCLILNNLGRYRNKVVQFELSIGLREGSHNLRKKTTTQFVSSYIYSCFCHVLQTTMGRVLRTTTMGTTKVKGAVKTNGLVWKLSVGPLRVPSLSLPWSHPGDGG